jgi:hypothetical protein
MKVSELTGALLDYWVARALGYQTDINKIKPGGDWCAIEMRRSASCARPDFDSAPSGTACAIAMVPNAMREFPACILGQKIGRGKHPYRSSWFYPSTVWDHGGPILERMRLLEMSGCVGGQGWYVRGPWRPCDGDQVYGDTLLIAAMRAFVTSKFGDEVEDVAPVAGASQSTAKRAEGKSVIIHENSLSEK